MSQHELWGQGVYDMTGTAAGGDTHSQYHDSIPHHIFTIKLEHSLHDF